MCLVSVFFGWCGLFCHIRKYDKLGVAKLMKDIVIKLGEVHLPRVVYPKQMYRFRTFTIFTILLFYIVADILNTLQCVL